jgi:hypothetical protein
MINAMKRLDRTSLVSQLAASRERHLTLSRTVAKYHCHYPAQKTPRIPQDASNYFRCVRPILATVSDDAIDQVESSA